MTSRNHRFPGRDARGGLGAARRLPATAPGSPRPCQGVARSIGSRRRAPVRPEQHPVRHEHAHRRGAREKNARFALLPRCRADPVGLRICGAPPPAFRAVAPQGELPRRCRADARRDARRDRDPGPARRADRARVARARPRGRAARSRHGRPGHDRGQRAACMSRGRVPGARGTKDQDRTGDLASTSLPVSSTRSTRSTDATAGRVRARDRRARHQLLFEMGSEQVEAVNAVSGDRCNPHPHVFSDRLLRPGTRRSSTSSIRSWATGRATTARSTSEASARRSSTRTSSAANGSTLRSSSSGRHDDGSIAVWPTAEELGFPDEETCFGLQFGHGSAWGCTSRR